MATEAQVKANQANAQHSTGPKTEEGKATVSQNNFRHGLNAKFQVLPWEQQWEYDALFAALRLQHRPETSFEVSLVEKMAQHYWLSRRALSLQENCFSTDELVCEQEKQLALYLRYQTTHERAFERCSDELRKLRNEKHQAEIGFELQKRRQDEDDRKRKQHEAREVRQQADEQRKQANETRRQAAENRKQELHQWAVLLAEAKVDHQHMLTSDIRFPQIVAQLKEEERERAQKAA
jgi:hypothetical protein